MEQIRPLIICDTNIWYRIADGTIDPQSLVNERLIGTYISGEEFCSSPNAYKDYDRLRRAVIAFGQYKFGFCIESPVEYMKLVSEHEFSNSKWDEIKKSLYAVSKMETLLDQALTRQIFTDHAEESKRQNQPFLDAIAEHRGKLGNKGLYKKNMSTQEWRLDHKEYSKEVITAAVGGLSLNWNALNLFISTFDEWLRQLSLQPTLTMTINDWNDVLNLVYVGPGSLYWTEDYKKTRKFIENSGYGHYLYQPVSQS